MTMHAHPMLTPLLPLQPPSTVTQGYPTDAAAAYTLIWNNTLGHLRVPQAAVEGFNSYQLGSQSIGVRWLSTTDPVLSTQLKELDTRRIAKSPVPLGSVVEVPAGDFVVESVTPFFVPAPGCNTDAAALIEWMDKLEVASTGRIAELLDELVIFGWATLEGDQYRLTPTGKTQLEVLRDSSLSNIDGATTAKWRDLTTAYLENSIGLADLVSRSNHLFAVSVSVPTDAVEALVHGEHTAEESYALRENAALKANFYLRFPAAMDPERLLPVGDPLWAQRDRLEAGLTMGRAHRWLCLSPSEKASIRMGALLTNLVTDEERQRFCSSCVFDVRSRWLIGLGPDAAPPSASIALRSYEAWANSKSV